MKSPALLLGLLPLLLACQPELSPEQQVLDQWLDIAQIEAGPVFEVPLEAGHAYRVVAHQHGVNVALGITLDRDSPIAWHDTMLHVRGPESALVMPGTASDLSVRIRPAMVAADGTVHLRVHRLFAQTDGDRHRIEAEQALASATLQTDSWDPEYWRPLVQSLGRAAETLDGLGLHQRAAWANYMQALLSYLYLGDWTGSAQLARAAARRFRALDQPRLEDAAMTLAAMALIERSEDQNPDDLATNRAAAQSMLAQVYERQLAAGAEVDAAWTLNTSGYGLIEEKKIEPGLQQYEAAAALAQQVGADAYYELILKNHAVASELAGHIIAAEQSLARIAENAVNRGYSSDLIANAHYEWGRINLVLGRWSKAIDALSRAVALQDQANSADRARSLVLLSLAYLNTGNLARARIYGDQALGLEADVLEGNDRRRIRLLAVELAAAEGNDQAALESMRGLVDQSAVAVEKGGALIMLAELQKRAGKLDEALFSAQSAERLLASKGLPHELARSRLLQAEIMLRSGPARNHEASIILETHAAALGGFPQPELRLRAALARSRLASALGDIDAALTHSEAAVRLLWSHRFSVPSSEFRLGYFDRHRELVRHHVGLLLAVERDAEAFAFADTYRAGSLRKAARQVAAGGEVAEKLAQVRNRISQLSYQILHADQKEPALEAAFEAALREYDRLEGQLPDRPAVALAEASLADLQARIAPGIQLVEYWLGEDYSVAWLVTASELHKVTLAAGTQIDGLVRRAMSETSRPGTGNAGPALTQLAAAVLHPLEPHLDGSGIVVVGDGLLQSFPVGILPRSDGSPLLANTDVSFAPALWALSAGAFTGASAPRIAIFADPKFSAVVQQPPELITRSATAGASDKLVALPGTRREAQRIARLFQPEQSTVLLGADASKSALLSGQFADFEMIHLATHGVIDHAHPAQSMIALAGSEAVSGGDLGNLTLQDLAQLSMNAELVVLSGCETALGRSLQSEGAVGFAAGFLNAGARRVLVSSWPVPDQATSDLMVEFYRNLIVENRAAPEALRRAQRSVAENSNWRHPYYWGGWLLIGA